MTCPNETLTGRPDDEPDSMRLKPSYDDRYVWLAIKANALLTPPLVALALALLPGTGILADLWLGFGAASVLVWTGMLVAGGVHEVHRAWRTARVAQRSRHRRLVLRRDVVGPTGDAKPKAMAA